MTDLQERLCDANDALETYLCAGTDATALPASEAGWEALSRISEKVHALGPSFNGVMSLNDVGVRNELRRYGTNIARLQTRCIAAIAELEVQRCEIWREEQGLRSQQHWQMDPSR